MLDESIIRLAVLLHDIDDAKYKSDANPSAMEILQSIGASKQLTDKIIECIKSVSFSGGNAQAITSIEGAIIRDADRLDAMGAIGIARTFAFGGAKGRKLYDKVNLSARTCLKPITVDGELRPSLIFMRSCYC